MVESYYFDEIDIFIKSGMKLERRTFNVSVDRVAEIALDAVWVCGSASLRLSGPCAFISVTNAFSIAFQKYIFFNLK